MSTRATKVHKYPQNITFQGTQKHRICPFASVLQQVATTGAGAGTSRDPIIVDCESDTEHCDDLTKSPQRPRLDMEFSSRVLACAVKVRDYLLSLENPLDNTNASACATFLACKFVLAAIQSPPSQEVVIAMHDLSHIDVIHDQTEYLQFETECNVFAHFGYRYVCGSIYDYRETRINVNEKLYREPIVSLTVLDKVSDILKKIPVGTPPRKRNDVDFEERDPLKDEKGGFIGGGAFGKVYLVSKTGSGRDVQSFYARKEIEIEGQDGLSVALIREVYMLRQLNHKNIVQMRAAGFRRYEPGFERGSYLWHNAFYIYMDVMVSLKDILYNGYTLKNHAFSMFEQMMEGLVFLHSEGVVHLDIKPANILCTPSGVIKLADFGLSAFRPIGPNASGTNEYGVRPVGTVTYRAPELFGRITTEGAIPYNQFQYDMWAMGVVLYELATGSNFLNYPRDKNAVLIDLFHKSGALIQIEERIGEMPDGYEEKYDLFKRKVKGGPSKPVIDFSSDLTKKLVERDLIQVLLHTLVYKPNDRWTSHRCLIHLKGVRNDIEIMVDGKPSNFKILYAKLTTITLQKAVTEILKKTFEKGA